MGKEKKEKKKDKLNETQVVLKLKPTQQSKIWKMSDSNMKLRDFTR